MGFFRFEHDILHRIDQRFAELRASLGASAQTQALLEKIMLNTTQLLAEVARANTESDSLIALVGANTAAQKVISDQLTAAIASNTDLSAKLAAALLSGDPAALAALQAQVTDLTTQLTTAQTDLDKATADLAAESTKAQAALDANVPPAPPTTP